MKILVAGLGIIGGSVALSLKKAGYAVDGWNRSRRAADYALEKNIVDNIAADFSVYDVVFVAMPPRATVEFIENNTFKDGAVVSDICGVKKPIEAAICAKYRNFSYVGLHPMAGREISGIEAACDYLFRHASLIVTLNADTDKTAVAVIEKLAADMGFGRIVECSAEVHDRKIAYTSQLAHVVSNAYVKDGDLECCLGFTGGSFQDMTRIAGVDENVWSELYVLNKDELSQKIGSLIDSLEEIKAAVESGNEKDLAKILANGRRLYENCKKIASDGDICVKKLR